MPDINPNDATQKHILTPTDFEAEVIIKRRKLYKMADQELARDWVITAQDAKKFRDTQPDQKDSDTGTALGRSYMTFPAKLWQRIEARFGSKWHQDKKLRKKVWDMYPEFRLRNRW